MTHKKNIRKPSPQAVTSKPSLPPGGFGSSLFLSALWWKCLAQLDVEEHSVNILIKVDNRKKLEKKIGRNVKESPWCKVGCVGFIVAMSTSKAFNIFLLGSSFHKVLVNDDKYATDFVFQRNISDIVLRRLMHMETNYSAKEEKDFPASSSQFPTRNPSWAFLFLLLLLVLILVLVEGSFC